MHDRRICCCEDIIDPPLQRDKPVTPTAPPRTLWQRLLRRLPFLMSCEEVEESVPAWLNNNLSGSRVFKLECHMVICKACQEFVRQHPLANDQETSD